MLMRSPSLRFNDDRKGFRPVEKTGCRFVGGDILTAAMHILQLQLSPTFPSRLFQ